MYNYNFFCIFQVLNVENVDTIPVDNVDKPVQNMIPQALALWKSISIFKKKNPGICYAGIRPNRHRHIIVKGILIWGLPSCLVTFTAVYWSVTFRFKWYLGRNSASCTNCIMHFSPAAIGAICSSAGFSLVTAGFASNGLILKTLFSVEFLFTSGKHKF